MFDSLKKAMSGETEITIGDVIIAEAGNGEFEAEDIIMESMGDIPYTDDDIDEDDFEDDFFEGLDEAGCKKNKVKTAEEDNAEISRLIESVLVDEEDDAANDYLDSIAGIDDDAEIAELVSKIPVDGADVDTGIDDPDLEKASGDIEDPTIEELADELDNEDI